MRAARLIRMALLVQSNPGLTAAALARELDVSERTVIRDAQALQEAGIPVRSERGRTGGYHLAPGYRTRLTTLHPTEAETLFLSGLPSALRDLGLSDAADTARLKLTATLLPSVRAAAEASVRRFHLDAPAWFRDPSAPELLPELARAVWSDRIVELSYARPGRDGSPASAVSRVVEPYGLVLKAGTWYVVARLRDRAGDMAGNGNGDGPGGGWRTYRVDRVTALAPAPGDREVFVRDADFDLAAHWQDRSHEFARALLRTTVTVRLTSWGLGRLPAVVDGAAVEDALASASAPDADGLVTLALPAESEDVAYDQLARLGADVEVLAPASLRSRFRERAGALAALYRPEPKEAASGARGQR
ncbi:helix-turn-helix transcriptional regulator [Streptomyces erythrochromogenes]|uniref:helix-turn-helix transcriptional regulator n=1 Tax=Streptomyces erythrochromogenes TaxID=285574 RepID=UPI00224E7220|nr:WYL domain-containing protein [Streptomyces erythrochromogenes]MCX5583265.1 WYL domain-containing protein [Streptomyces erythrochromogenes]